MQARTAQYNADEFGGTERGMGGWNQAVLVACSVGNGPGQVSMSTFAGMAQVSVPTVSNYAEAWDLAVAKGVEIPPRTALSPDKVGTFPLPAQPFNGPGGFVKTRKGGANSTDAIMDKIKSGSGAYADRMANDPEVLASLIKTAKPEALAAALSQVSGKTLQSVKDKTIDAQIANHQLDVIIAGGKPFVAKSVDTGVADEIAASLEADDEIEEMITSLVAHLDARGMVGPDTRAARILKETAMRLLDFVGLGAGVEVSS